MDLCFGSNYFWVSYDIASGATSTNLVDALCNRIIVDAVNRFPTVTTPAGTREVDDLPPTYTRTFGTSTGANWSRAALYDASDNTHVLVVSSSETGITAGSYDNMIVKVDQADLNDNDLVLGVMKNGTAVAFPIRFLAMYEVVDSNVGKLPVAPTW